MPVAISASSSANKSSARTVCDSSMMWSRAAKQISASASGMMTISADIMAAPSGRACAGFDACDSDNHRAGSVAAAGGASCGAS